MSKEYRSSFEVTPNSIRWECVSPKMKRVSWVKANQIYKSPYIHNEIQEKMEKLTHWSVLETARVPGHFSEGRSIKGELSIILPFLNKLYIRATKELMKERSSKKNSS